MSEQLGDLLYDQAMWMEYKNERIEKWEIEMIQYSNVVSNARNFGRDAP